MIHEEKCFEKEASLAKLLTTYLTANHIWFLRTQLLQIVDLCGWFADKAYVPQFLKIVINTRVFDFKY